jgi:hypothetical protein
VPPKPTLKRNKQFHNRINIKKESPEQSGHGVRFRAAVQVVLTGTACKKRVEKQISKRPDLLASRVARPRSVIIVSVPEDFSYGEEASAHSSPAASVVRGYEQYEFR